VPGHQEVSTQQGPDATKTFAPPPNLDATYLSEGLPSYYRFYDFQALHMRPFVPREQFALQRARTEGNINHTIAAISATIQGDAYRLTVGDFWFLMYQQRLRSYKKSPFMVGPWQCTSDVHLKAIEDKQTQLEELRKLPRTRLLADAEDPTNHPIWSEEQDAALVKEIARLEESRTQSTQVKDSMLNIKPIEEDQWVKIAEHRAMVLKEYDIDLIPITMRSMAEVLDEKVSEEEAEYVMFQNRYAAVLGPRHGKTLQERRQFLMDSPHTELLNDIDTWLGLIEHGVEERFKCVCKECGMSDMVKQAIDIPHFFPRLVG
jgi:hypothetical protein